MTLIASPSIPTRGKIVARPDPNTAHEQIARYALSLRRHVIRMVGRMGQGYVQQGLGAAELFATLFCAELRLDPEVPEWVERDRFLLSTAHNSAVFHAALAERGLIDRDALATYCRDGSPLEINVSERLGPCVEATLGSLGQGLSVGLGMAIAAQRRDSPSRIYVLLGDGEMQEGQTWEAAMAAGSLGLANLCLIVDCNNMQVEGPIDRVLRMLPIADKWRAFGWHAIDVDGHDVGALLASYAEARRKRDKPTVILARTMVGKGVDFLEGQFGHNMKLSRDDAEAALRQLGDDEGLA
jgi:transketolase